MTLRGVRRHASGGVCEAFFDRKGLYGKARRGELPNFTAVDAPTHECRASRNPHPHR